MLFGTIDLCLVSDHLTCEKKLGPYVLWQADRQKAGGFGTFKIFYRLKYLDFYFANIIAMLLIVLEVNFSWFFSNKVYFRYVL